VFRKKKKNEVKKKRKKKRAIIKYKQEVRHPKVYICMRDLHDCDESFLISSMMSIYEA
jgi:hypothetical protein